MSGLWEELLTKSSSGSLVGVVAVISIDVDGIRIQQQLQHHTFITRQDNITALLFTFLIQILLTLRDVQPDRYFK